MRVVYIVVALIFAAFAGVQFNDPDGGIWVAAYLFAALVTVPPIFGRHTPLPALGLAVFLVWSVMLIGAVDADWLEHEEAREAVGLLLATLWMGVLLYLWARDHSRRRQVAEQNTVL